MSDGTSPPPPPPPSDWDEHTPAIRPVPATLAELRQTDRDHEKRIRSVEKCTRDTAISLRHLDAGMTEVRETLKGNEAEGKADRRWLIGLALTGAIFCAGGVVALIRTTQQVETIDRSVQEAADDRNETHDEVRELREGLIGVAAAVKNTEREAERRDRETQRRLDDIAKRLDRRRR